MESIRATQKKYGSLAMTIAIIAAVALIVAGHKDIGKGLVLGTFFSIVNFVLIGETLPARMGQAQKKAFLFSLGSIFVRFALLAVPIVVGIKSSEINLVAAVIGLFTVQIVLLGDHIAGSFLAKLRRSH